MSDPLTGRPRARRRGLLILAGIVALAALAWAVMAFALGTPNEDTDDAYVAGDVVTVTAREAGVVLAIHADTTQVVKAGQPLIDLDTASADIALARAEAELARAVRATRAQITEVGGATAQVVLARAQLERANADFRRRRGAAAEGAVSGEELAHAADQIKVARAQLQLAQAQQRQSQAAVQGTDASSNPQVLAAAAAVRQAAIVRGHMRVTAPIDGTVALRPVQLGQQIAAGTPLMSVVPLERVWVDANFRETQLKDLRIGQRATVTADMYGDDLVFHGRVIGVGAGSGSAFALLPPQNASGNWIKVVQRVPVRIALDAGELRRNPLRIGLSVHATVDTADRSGPRLGATATRAYQGVATEQRAPAVEARIRQIIASNR
ncbi:efflux RND transporter periplasmic adaptor subunit [Sphingomonas sp.]|jgi:membrane fusion protein (multidrug efflux system)|uniref:efflux RND transporter periplasmic adaptor subunit n=1 Tax=Sphingomonas sp. TaxID=28214 RepID=UPI002D7EAB8C|nr:efflux RND transporter periplasmic adaptor subunit [Sphingomonas sp.]HEU0044342.1 efflux RND transporter periplasmic adaptor subunit [Sphingomonas sp.]